MRILQRALSILLIEALEVIVPSLVPIVVDVLILLIEALERLEHVQFDVEVGCFDVLEASPSCCRFAQPFQKRDWELVGRVFVLEDQEEVPFGRHETGALAIPVRASFLNDLGLYFGFVGFEEVSRF